MEVGEGEGVGSYDVPHGRNSGALELVVVLVPHLRKPALGLDPPMRLAHRQALEPAFLRIAPAPGLELSREGGRNKQTEQDGDEWHSTTSTCHG